MAIRYPTAPARSASRTPRCDTHRQRMEAERQRRADFARMNTAIAKKLR
jgi:hypothetical protein